jgi:hypothetical protein
MAERRGILALLGALLAGLAVFFLASLRPAKPAEAAPGLTGDVSIAPGGSD